MVKRLWLLLLLIAVCSDSFAQNEQLNLQKYWHYRYRLVNYYLVVGEGPGMSLPADIRHRYNGGSLRWGEGTVYLGYYIGVLATEYRLLKDAGQNTDQTLTELYYALKAAVRLDNVAEASWNLPNATNGFLIRDDVPSTFLQDHYTELNRNLISQWPPITIGSGRPGEVTSMESDYYSNYLAGTPEDNAVSQDNIYPLIMGFALVNRFVDSGMLSFYDYVAGASIAVDIKDMAIDETDCIVQYVKENTHGVSNHHWVIKDPNGNIVIGGNPIFCAHALALAGEMITGEDYVDFHTDPAAWQLCQDPNFTLCDPISNQSSVHPMVMVLAALTNSFEAFGPNGANTTPSQILALGDYDAGGIGGCAYFDSHFGWDVFYGMLWDVFHGGPNYIGDLCYAQQILNSAFWDGPFYHDATDKAYPGWCASRRFFDDSPRQNNGKPAFEGNYNGLDFMLMYNLYHLDSREQGSPLFVPQNSPFVSATYPYFFGQNIYGDISSPSQIFSPDFPVIVNQLSVNTNGTVPGLGDLTIYGGATGVLLTNTSVDQYSRLTAFNTSTNTMCIPLQSYFFDPTGYVFRMQNEVGNSGHLNYTPSPEFLSMQNSGIFLYPNPANSEISIGAISGVALVEITNTAGVLIKRIENYTSSERIDISELTAGAYFVRVKTTASDEVLRLIRQ